MNFINSKDGSVVNIETRIRRGFEGFCPGDSLLVGNETLEAITEKQAESVPRVLGHQGSEALIYARYDTLCECLMLQFKHITIGIEEDGYAHS